MMKTRFRAIFLTALEVHHTFVPHVGFDLDPFYIYIIHNIHTYTHMHPLLNCFQLITACTILHNICLGAGDVMAPEDDPEEAVEEDEVGTEAVSGALWQDQLSAEVSALEEVPPEHDYCVQ
ncbi:hypothetical protein CRENBAI_003836 [Crenichthys baileyi]|uniref:DDE Tnp4 domain-containing protein n=1 Tax=Crenichthys baileyi TaxID=28760 RepID=A0AAV9RNU0_9TELE